MPQPQTQPLVARKGWARLLVDPAHADEAVAAWLAAAPAPPRQAHDREAFDRTLGERPEDAPYGSYKVHGTTALVPVIGPLIPRGLSLGGYSTAYEALGGELRRAAADASVDRIALMIDSPGGYVSGLDGAAAAIAAARAEKPVVAYVSGMACSAAYWLASACEAIVASPLADLGSIGVVQVHFDVSGLLEAFGVKTTLIYAGAKKVDGNPFEALSERAKAEMQADCEGLRRAFAEAVAAGRPSLDVAAVLATEAATFRGPDAVARGLADRIGFLADDLPDDDPLDESDPMARFRSISMTTYTQAQLDQALADARKAAHAEGRTEGHAAGKTEGHADGLAAGAAAERDRFKAIRGCEEAKKRPKAAEHVALATAMPLAEAQAFLAGLDEETAATSLQEEMRDDVQPRVGADGGRALTDLKGEERGAAIATSLGLAKKKAA